MAEVPHIPAAMIRTPMAGWKVFSLRIDVQSPCTQLLPYWNNLPNTPFFLLQKDNLCLSLHPKVPTADFDDVAHPADTVTANDKM